MQTTQALTAVAALAIATSFTNILCTPSLADESPKEKRKPVSFKLAKPDKPLILLETMVNGKGPFRFVLDTGAGGTIISPELAKKLDIKSEKRDGERAVGAGGNLDIQFGSLKSLAIGETQVKNLNVGIMDLTGISKAIETDIDGIVGYNFLTKFRVTIDYPKSTVTFE
jgi:predicted aspartyl protease